MDQGRYLEGREARPLAGPAEPAFLEPEIDHTIPVKEDPVIEQEQIQQRQQDQLRLARAVARSGGEILLGKVQPEEQLDSSSSWSTADTSTDLSTEERQ